jgi:hypothetical protein
LLQAEETAVVKYIKKSEDFSLKPIHAAAYMLDPKYAGKSILSGAEINKAYGVITSTSRHLGLEERKVSWQSGEVHFQARALGWRCNMAVVPTCLISQIYGRDFVDLMLFPLLPRI